MIHKRFSVILPIFILFPLFSFGEDLTPGQIDSINAMPYQYITSNPYRAIKTLEENLRQARFIHYRYGEAKALEALHLAYGIAGKLEKRNDAALKAITIYEELGKISDLANMYGRYGYEQRKRDFNTAKKYMVKGMQLAKKNKLTEQLAVIYDNYGVLQEESNNSDSAMYYYQKSLHLKNELKDSLGIPYTLNNIAGIYATRGQFEKALEYAARSDEYRNKEKGEFGRALNLVLYAEIYQTMGKLDISKDYYGRCLKKSKKIGFKDLIRYCYLKLSELEEQQQNYQKALQTYKQYVAYKDSLVNVETNAKMGELEIVYETEKKDLLLAQKELKLRRRNLFLIISLAIAGVLLVLTIGTYRFQKLKRKRLRKELELQNRIKQSELEKKISEEKLRISRELHDNIGSRLTFMISSLDNLRFRIKEKTINKQISDISQFGRNTMTELRNSIWAMKFEEGSIQELILKINDLKQAIKKNGSSLSIEIRNRVKTHYALGSMQMLNMYRIVQEALQNVIKYAQATKVCISFCENEKGLEMTITDNGVGFDTTSVRKGSGLKNMQQRCEAINGEWYLASSAHNTTVRCVFKL